VAKKKSPAKKRPAKKTKKSSSQAGLLVLGDGQWPLERDVLFRPDRLKYVRKLIKDEGCVFCRSAREPASFETLQVFATKWSMVVLNKFPYNSGHLLILPRRHCGDIAQLTQDEWTDLSDLQRRALEILREVYQPAGFNMGLNQGSVAGAGIPDHLHFHLIPRWAGDLNFFPLIAETKVVIETLETTYARLQKGFEQIQEPK